MLSDISYILSHNDRLIVKPIRIYESVAIRIEGDHSISIHFRPEQREALREALRHLDEMAEECCTQTNLDNEVT